MLGKFKKLSLEKQLFTGFLSVSILLLLLSVSITLTFNLTRRRADIDKNISEIAAYIASTEPVVSMLEAGYPDPAAISELDAIAETFSDINVIVIYNTSGLRFYHTNRQETGETFIEGEEKAILSGSAPYIASGYGTHGAQRRAFHAIQDSDGAIIGFVMASVFNEYISDQIQALFPAYAAILGIMLPVGVLFSHGTVRLLRSSLMGHHPEELLDLYLKQDTVLNAMAEGLLASNREGTVIFANQAARAFFDGCGDLTGRPVQEFFSDSKSRQVLETAVPSFHRPYAAGNRRLLVSELPIENHGVVQGVLTILNDQTDMETMADELSGARAMLDTLRAFNHEFLNKLHVILGYLQTGQTEAAIRFITNSSLLSSQSIRQTADCLRVSKICALVIGKMMHAAELGIVLSVTPDSRCMDKDLLLPVDSCITIAGNLLENAIEELSAGQKEVREITLGIFCTEDCNIITCEDTGNGIPAALLDVIYEKGVSSKGPGRGTGLYLIKNLVDQYHGEIAIETETGEGTCFTLTFTREEH